MSNECPNCPHPRGAHFRGNRACMHTTPEEVWACSCNGVESLPLCPTCKAETGEQCLWLEPGQYHYGRHVVAAEKQKETSSG